MEDTFNETGWVENDLTTVFLDEIDDDNRVWEVEMEAVLRAMEVCGVADRAVPRVAMEETM